MRHAAVRRCGIWVLIKLYIISAFRRGPIIHVQMLFDPLVSQSTLLKLSSDAIYGTLLPNLSEATRDFHRWRYNEMILETYQMAI